MKGEASLEKGFYSTYRLTAQCITESADKAVYDGALAMAWTAIDLANDESLRSRLLMRQK